MEILGIRTASLGDTSYFAIGDGSAIVIDPQRDLGRFFDVLDERGLTVTHVLETHMHNDYISGGRDLAQRTGADLVLPAASGASFAFVPAFHGEIIEGANGILIFPMHTPGHTPAHTSYVVGTESGAEPSAAFTGGSLLVGAAGRSDLLGEESARQLAVLQYGSLRRLATLPEDTGVYPTHGEGSFCTASSAGRATSTIGEELRDNPLYEFTDAVAFADSQLASLVPYPSYYQFMGPINREGPTALETPVLPELGPAAVAEHLAAGGAVVDGRNRYEFAAGHIPGAIGIELGDSFAPWSGWLLDFDAPVALVLNRDQDAVEAAVELGRVGLESVVGVLYGMDDWAAADKEVASYSTATISELDAAMTADPDLQVVDCRDPVEWEAGHLPASVHRYLPDLRAGLPGELDIAQPVWIVCRTGNRASIAAGILEGHGVEFTIVAKGGVPDLVG